MSHNISKPSEGALLSTKENQGFTKKKLGDMSKPALKKSVVDPNLKPTEKSGINNNEPRPVIEKKKSKPVVSLPKPQIPVVSAKKNLSKKAPTLINNNTTSESSKKKAETKTSKTVERLAHTTKKVSFKDGPTKEALKKSPKKIPASPSSKALFNNPKSVKSLSDINNNNNNNNNHIHHNKLNNDNHNNNNHNDDNPNKHNNNNNHNDDNPNKHNDDNPNKHNDDNHSFQNFTDHGLLKLNERSSGALSDMTFDPFGKIEKEVEFNPIVGDDSDEDDLSLHETPRVSKSAFLGPKSPMKKNQTGEGYYYYYQAFEKNSAQLQSGARDWNAEFQDIVDGLGDCQTEKESLENYIKLSRLAQDFTYVAKTFGKIIILEHTSEKKTVKPISIGGFAGGSKFLVQGILFKFAVDQHNLYGDDGISAKAAGHELKGLTAFYKAGVKGLHFPLMALIDWRGYRLIAQSVLPLEGPTGLIYGSNDGGRTVKASDEHLNSLMQEAGKRLNLKGHKIGLKDQKAFIYGPTDIEGHIGKDKRFYLLDFQRTFPPQEIKNQKRSYLYMLLRSEFVSKYPKALSSDALSGFGADNQKEHNQEVRDATQFLISHLIPSVAKVLDEQMQADKLSTKNRIVELCHKEGINIRNFGYLRSYSQVEELKNVLLLEMVSRVIKVEIRKKFRDFQKEEKRVISSDKPFKIIIADYFNTILGKTSRSGFFWSGDLRALLMAKFVHCLSTAEMEPNYDLRKLIDLPLLFQRISQISGIKISSVAHSAFITNRDSFVFVYPDIEKLSAVVKHMNITAHAEAMTLYHESSESEGPESDRLFQLSMEKFEAAPSFGNAFTLKSWGDALREQSHKKRGPERTKLVDSASEKYKAIDSVVSLCKMAEDLSHEASIFGGEERTRLFRLATKNFECALQKCGQQTQDSEDYSSVSFKYAISLCLEAQLKEKPSQLESASERFLPALKRAQDPAFKIILDHFQKEEIAIVLQYYLNHKCKTISTSTCKFITDVILSKIEKHFQVEEVAIAQSLVFTGSVFEKRQFNHLKKLSIIGNLHVKAMTVFHILKAAPSLESLNLEGCTYIGFPEKESNTLQTLNLTSLNIANSQFNTESLQFLSPLIPQLEELNASGCSKITDVTSLTKHARQLKLLNLSQTSVNDITLSKAFALLSPAFISLSMTNIPKISNCVALLAKNAPNLTSLNLGNSPIPDAVLFELFHLSALKEVNLMKSRDISQSFLKPEFLQMGSFQFSSLNLSECIALSDEMLKLLLERTPHLTSLRLSGCFKVSGEPIIAFSKTNPQLTVLSLKSCDKVSEDHILSILNLQKNISDLNLGSSKITDQSIPVIAHLPLTHLNLGLCPLVTDLSPLQTTATLQALTISYMPRLNFAKFQKNPSKEHFPNLQKLDIRESKTLTDEQLYNFLKHSCHLEELWIDNCLKIGDNFLLDVCQLCSLKTLKASGCTRLTDRGVSIVCSRSPQLTQLYLSRCFKITDSSAASVLRFCPNVQTIHLAGCKKLTDQTLSSLSQLPLLTKVVMDHCPVVSKSAISKFLKENPNLLETSFKSATPSKN